MIQNKQRGFTLVELLVVVTIVAILASIAIPSYREYLKRASRSEAKTALLENAQFLERNRTVTNKYDTNAADGAVLTAANLPVTHSPKDGTPRYTIKFADGSPTDTTFTLIAEPTEGGGMVGDKCGSLTLDETGKKGITADGATVADCWNR